MSWFIRVILLLLIPLPGCMSSRQNVIVHELPNYDSKAIHQILFMDFTIRRTEPGKPERLTMTNAIIGRGEMKNLGGRIHAPYQLEILQYRADQPPIVDRIEHPLFRSIETAHTDGSLDRTLTSGQTGQFSFRLPYTGTLTKIELYSVTPDQGTRKIYTLRIKP